MQRNTNKLICLTICLIAGCFTVKPVNVSQRTSLEQQLIGTLDPLTEEEALAASVRAGGSTDGLQGLRSRAVAARRRQLFNRDDIQELKSWGCLGEDAQGLLQPRSCSQTEQTAVQTLQKRLVEEENADRSVVVDLTIANDPILTPSDRLQVFSIYRRLLHDAAAPGDWHQEDDGTWRQK